MKFFKRKEKVLDTPIKPENKVHDKESLLADIEERRQNAEKIANEIYDKVEKESPQKMAELSYEEYCKWFSNSIERAKKNTEITIPAKNMHFFGERFFRIIKSSPQIAENSIEGHPFIKSEPGQVSKDVNGEYGLCFVTANNAIQYLSYGDGIAEIDFNPEELSKFNLSESSICYTPHGNVREFNASELLIKDKFLLNSPENLKLIIKMSDDDSFSRALSTQDTLKYSEYFKKFGFEETARAWDNVMLFAEKYKENTSVDAHFIREHIDQIIPEITIDAKLNSFNAINNNNNITIENKLDAR
jgi:hypothetical protein